MSEKFELNAKFSATIQYWWDDAAHIGYRIGAMDRINTKAKEIAESFADVEVDSDYKYNCQYEGVRLISEDQDELIQAARDMVNYIEQFKHIRIQ